MEAPMLSYCPCLIHSHTLAHTCIYQTHTLTAVVTYGIASIFTLVSAVPAVLCVHLQHLQQRSSMLERLFSGNTKLILAKSVSIMEVQWKNINENLIFSTSFYNEGLAFAVLTIIPNFEVKMINCEPCKSMEVP